jgi:membrane associated rhomboid family serine protease
MLDDRPYMRSDYEPPGSPLRLSARASTVLMVSLVAVFVLQQIDLAYLHLPTYDYLPLSTQGLLHGYVWQLLTFQFLHAGILHLGFNLIGLWFFGRYVEDRLGPGRFLTLYFLSGVAGGLLQCLLGLAFPNYFGIPTMGASAGIFGLIAAFCMLEPEGIILMFFVLPMKAKHLLYISAGVALFFIIVPTDPGVAHAAHLGGMLFGVFYIRKGLQWTRGWVDWKSSRRESRREQLLKAAGPKPFKPRRAKPAENPELPSEEFISQEVDPILDKISAHGIQSLTERERQILQAARSRMSRR